MSRLLSTYSHERLWAGVYRDRYAATWPWTRWNRLSTHAPIQNISSTTATGECSIGDSYDNALAETIIGLYKTEVIHQDGPWRNVDHVEFETLDWVDWFNTRRLLEPIGYIPPAEFETLYWQRQDAPVAVAGLN